MRDLHNMIKNKPVVVFTTPILHHPPLGGPALRIENTIKALSQICDLWIVFRGSIKDIGGEESLRFYKSYCKQFYLISSHSTPGRFVHILKRGVNFISKRLLGISPFGPDEAHRRFLKLAQSINPEIIWLGYGNISYPLLRYVKRHAKFKTVVDTDSVWSRFILRGLPYAQSDEERQTIHKSGRKKEEEELCGTQLADITTAVSEVDADYYRKLAKHPRQIHTFSNVIDIDSYQQIPPVPEGLKRPSIYLAGTFWPHSPMEDAARWAITDILPLVRRDIPDIHFYIVGSGSDEILHDIKDPAVTITGRLPSVLPYLCHSNVALVPLRFESGTRFKILEAGASGTPVVSTTLGAEGISITHGENILIADDPQTIADSIVKLINDPHSAAMMARKLKKLIYEKYSIKALVEEGNLILEGLFQQTNRIQC